jgi:hypothetical protein
MGDAIVRTSDEAKAIAKILAGEEPPDRCRFACLACGWNGTLHFDEGEMEALGGDAKEYQGPCPGVGPVVSETGERSVPEGVDAWMIAGCTLAAGLKCGMMTLRPSDSVFDKNFVPVNEQARVARRAEYKEQAEVLVETVVDRFVPMANPARASGEPTPAAAASAAETVDIDALKPRPSE